MPRKSKVLKRLGAITCLFMAGVSASFAQSAPAPSSAAEVVEMPPLIADLFRSTPGGAPAPAQVEAPLVTPAGPANPPLPGSSAPSLSTAGDFVPDEVIVALDGDGTNVAQIAADLGLQIRSQRTSFLLGTTVVRFGIPPGRSVGAVLAQLGQDARSRNAGANHIYTTQQSAPVKGFAFTNIAFDTGDANGSGVRIAVIDTARDTKHPSLTNITAEDFDALPDVPVADAKHGTSIIGVIAGQDGFQGLAPGAQILHARAFEQGKSNIDAILTALDWSAEQNAQIINMSFVGPRNELFERAIKAAHERGIVLIAAAGNNGPTAPPAFPAAYKQVIAVTATDEKNARFEMANVGPYVRISAPGVGVMAPIPGGGFDLIDGTSIATAVYTGALANLMRRQPEKSGFDIDDIFAKSALDLGKKGRDVEFGFGLVNVRAALDIK
jgi:Subtilase family